MTFAEFTNNVEQWALERGIYRYSTPDAQMLKAFEELGELARHLGKGDLPATKDDIGDVAVCLINFCYMVGLSVPTEEPLAYTDWDFFELVVAILNLKWNTSSQEGTSRAAFIALERIARECGHTFQECCEHAWNEIKDRKGKMVEGGFFVKEEL